MAQYLTFDLTDTTVPAGTLKIRVDVDMTNFSALTGTSFALTGDQYTEEDGVGAFETELRVGSKIYVTVDEGSGDVEHVLTVESIESDNACTVSYSGASVTGLAAVNKALAVPMENFIIEMDEHTERVDLKMGLYEYDDFKMQFADDYSFYNAGFWYHIYRTIGSTVLRFFVRLEENSVESFVTFGNVSPSEISFDEIAFNPSNISGTKIRTVSIVVLSGVNILKSVNIAQLLTDLFDNRTETRDWFGQANQGTLKLINVINSAVALAFGQDYDANCVQVRNNDFRFKISTAASDYFYFDDLYILGNSASLLYGVLCSASPIYWGNVYPTAFEVIQNICFAFGFVPRHYYGQADGTYAGDGTDIHRIELLTRGNAEAKVEMTGSIIRSRYYNQSPYSIGNVLASLRSDPSVCDYFYNASLVPNTTNIAEVYGTEPPSFIQFDLSLVFDFRNPYSYTSTFPYLETMFGVIVSPSTDIDNAGAHTEYYDYVQGDWVSVSTVDGSEPANISNHIKALAKYYFYKFKGQAMYEREYSDVRADDGTTESQRNVRCLRRIDIQDEYDTRTFYAIEVKKSYLRNTASMKWFQQ